MDQLLSARRRVGLVLIWAVVLLMAPEAWAAIAHVQTQTSTASGTTQDLTVTFSVTANNGAVVNLLYDTDGGSVGTVSKTAPTDACTQRFTNNPAGGAYAEQWSCETLTGGSTTFTFHRSGTGSFNSRIFVSEVSGQLTSGMFDVSKNNATITSATTHDTGATAAVTADDLAIALLHGDGSGGTSVSSVSDLIGGSNYTVPPNGDQTGSGTMPGAVAWKAITSGLTTNARFTTAASETGFAVVGTYKPTTFVGGYILTESGACLNAENSNRLITEDVSAGVGPCAASGAPQRMMIGVGT